MFGVACKLPPSLTILILNGCFCFPIGCCAVRGVLICGYELKNVDCSYMPVLNSNGSDSDTETETTENEQQSQSNNEENTCINKESLRRLLKGLRTIMESIAFLMQLGALVSISVLLSIEHFFEPSEISKHYFTATYILIPLSLLSISVVWSGWIQDRIMRSSNVNNTTGQSSSGKGSITARYKTGN